MTISLVDATDDAMLSSHLEGARTDGLETRIFNIVGVAAVLLGFSTALLNYFLGNPIREVFISLGVMGLGGFFYTASTYFHKDQYLRIPLILIFLGVICVVWITNQGSQGSTPLFAFNLFILCAVILRAPYNGLFLLISLAVIVALLAFEQYNPSAILPYLSENHRSIDVSFSLVISLTTVTTVVYFVVQEYKKERVRNNVLYRQTLRDKAALEQAMAEIKVLEGILPVCSFCKKIRDEDNEWNVMESYISKRSGAEFSHGVCPDCGIKHYPEFLK